MLRFLLILCIATAATAGWAVVRAGDAADRASAAAIELRECRDLLSNPARRSQAQQLGLLGRPAAGGTSQQAARGTLESGIRQASVATGIAERLRNVAWANPVAVAGSDQRETKAFLRLDGVTLQELTRFLLQLSQADPTSRSSMIELSTPSAPVAEGSSEERWSADITLAYRVGPAKNSKAD